MAARVMLKVKMATISRYRANGINANPIVTPAKAAAAGRKKMYETITSGMGISVSEAIANPHFLSRTIGLF